MIIPSQGRCTIRCKPSCSTCADLRAAAISIVGADGLHAVTLERLASVSGIEPDELAEHYADALSCLYDSYDEVSRNVLGDFASAFTAERRWRSALRLASQKLLRRMAAHPDQARLCFVEVLRGDHELLRRREASRRRLVELFVRELGRRREDEEQLSIQLELLIGAAFQAIAAAVAEDRIEELPQLEPELESRALVFEPVAA